MFSTAQRIWRLSGDLRKVCSYPCVYIKSRHDVPLNSANHPSDLKRPTRFIMPQVPSALPTGITYSGCVPSSSKDCRMM